MRLEPDVLVATEKFFLSYLQHHLETRIGRAMIASEVGEGCAIQVDAEDGELKILFAGPQSCDVPDQDR
jgi:hypothetical protein